MTHYQFFEFLQKWKKFNKVPPASGWPSEISLGKDFWDGVIRLYKYTASNNHEYETSFFFVDGKTISTPPLKGEKSSVTSKHQLNVKYVPKDKYYYEKQIIIDGKILQKESVRINRLPKKIDLGFLFNVHSHPAHYLDQGGQRIKTYSFFSATDINSLIHSSSILSGLVTDEFWLVCKTDKTISRIGEVGMEMLQRISNKAYSGDKYLEDIISKEMKDWGLIFYKARFNSILKRVI